MSTRGGVRIPITADARGVGDGVRDAERALDRLNKSANRSFSGLRLAAGGAALAIGGGLVAAAQSGIQGMQDAQKAAAQLDAVLKSTGNTAGLTRDQMIAMADSMERQTGIASETTQQAQALLATFSSIGRETFPGATKAAIDMSVAFDQSAKSSAIQLGKALQDPIKGVTALQRIGVSFTDQQRDQIRTLVESNKTQQAQALILREVNKQVQGSANAYGRTLPGQLARAQHAWGEITEELMTKLLPAMTAVLSWVNRNMPRIQAAINGVVKFVSAIIRQDWAEAWKYAERVLRVALNGIVAALRALGPWLGRAAADAGRAIARGIWSGFEATLVAIPGSGAVRRILGMSSGDVAPGLGPFVRPGGGFGPPARRAMGGYIPGPRGAGDIVPALLTPGEVVLNERQQQMVGVDRIMEILARTGGVMGGGRFNRGGVVAAQGFAEQARGARYLSVRPQPAGTFDCSSFAGMAARAAGSTVSPPGSTATYIGQISPPQGDDPILFGFRPYRSASQYNGGGDEHMGIRINGVWWESGGRGNPAVGPGKSTDASWTILGVPKGLENLRVTGADDSVGGGSGRPRVTFGQLLEAATRGAPGGVVGRTTRTRRGPVTVGTEVSSIAGAYRGAVPDVSAGFDTGPGGADQRSIDRAGRDARAGARAAGKSPEEVRREGDEAEANATKAWYRREIQQINRAMAGLKRRKARLLQSISDLRASRSANRVAKRRVIRALSGRVAQINAELSELREIRAELQNSLGEIIDAEQMESYETAATSGEGDAAATSSDASGGVADVDQAELVRARTNMLMTEWNMTGMGTGDLGSGGATAMSAAFPGGRTVTLTVGATSLVSAVASASGTQGYSTPAVVPAGV